MRPKHYQEYKDIPEIVPGVFVAPDGVYIVDDEGEVVMWTSTEWLEDESAVIATVNAVILATAKGASAVRQNLKDKGNTLEKLVIETDLFGT